MLGTGATRGCCSTGGTQAVPCRTCRSRASNGTRKQSPSVVGDPAAAYLLTPLCSRLSLLDLVVAMAPYADEQSLGSLYSTIQPSLQVSRGAPSARVHPAGRGRRVTPCKGATLTAVPLAVPAEQGAQHAEEGVPGAGGGVCRSPCPLPGLRLLAPGGAAGSAAGLAQERGVPGQEGENESCCGWRPGLPAWVSAPGCSSPQPWLKCLFHIVKQLSAEHEPFVTALVPEVSVGPGGLRPRCVCAGL